MIHRQAVKGAEPSKPSEAVDTTTVKIKAKRINLDDDANVSDLPIILPLEITYFGIVVRVNTLCFDLDSGGVICC